ncbi:restriction endonuclease subunit S [Microcoleus sp. Pol11C3]|uniref:restriction endonuclease subunit S n=1 Tax=Microcoleus sp. Pol11C3 TaxID=3055390 RepID=UPI002FD492C0
MKKLVMMPLNKLLFRHKDSINIEEFETYKRITIRMNNHGVVMRDCVSGSEIGTKKQFIAKAGQLVLSKIDARNSAFGILPKECDGAIITGNFWAFDVNYKLLDTKYFNYLTHTPLFVEFCIKASDGTTNRRYLDESKFLSMQIPLPPLDEQRRIVARIEELAGKVEEARGLRWQSAEENQLIIKASLQKFFSPTIDSIELGKVCTVIDPNPSHRYPIYIEDGVPIISTVDFVGEDAISTVKARRVPVSFYEDTLGRFGVGEGDVIFSRKGKIGYARLHPANIKLAMTHTLCVIQPEQNKLLPKYLLYYTKSSAFIDYLMGIMNPNSGVPTLGLGVIRSAPFNLPPLEEQHRIVAYLDNLQTKVDALKRLQAETAAELDALLPSILDKAFKGEL